MKPAPIVEQAVHVFAPCSAKVFTAQAAHVGAPGLPYFPALQTHLFVPLTSAHVIDVESMQPAATVHVLPRLVGRQAVAPALPYFPALQTHAFPTQSIDDESMQLTDVQSAPKVGLQSVIAVLPVSAVVYPVEQAAHVVSGVGANGFPK